MNRNHWPRWARLANAAGRCIAAAEKGRPPGVTRYQRLILMQTSPAPRWLVSEIAAEHCHRMAHEEYPA